jgi:hypothetical protein
MMALLARNKYKGRAKERGKRGRKEGKNIWCVILTG